MATSAPSRYCSRACRSLQASWMMKTRFQSTSAVGAAVQQEASGSGTKVASNSSSSLAESSQDASNDSQRIQGRKLSSKRQLNLARAISLYHHSLNFPDFLPPSPNNIPSNEYNLNLPPIPPRVDNYIRNKLHSPPLSPLRVDLSSMKLRAKSRPISPRHDPHSYMDNAERATLSLGPRRRQGSDSSENSQLKKWDALSPLASRESQTRAKKMVDALLGTVDAREPGLKMVQTVYEINNGSNGKQNPQSSPQASS